MRLVGKVPTGMNFDLGLHFLATPWPGLNPSLGHDETYYALLAGNGAGPTIYGVNVTEGGGLASTASPWLMDGWPSFAHWLAAMP